METIMRPGSFFILFRIIRFLPYIAIGLLMITIAVWVIFGIKKFRWAKVLAIILTVIVLFTGLCSLAPFAFGGSRGVHLPRDQQQFRRWDEEGNKDARVNIHDYGSYYVLEAAAALKAKSIA